MKAAPSVREAELRAADAIGDVIEFWGFRRALGRTWTVLYLQGEALSAAELSERLQMSPGSVSTTLTELLRWGVVHRVTRPGERKDFYEAENSLWKMISRVISDRERHMTRSVRERLEQAAQLLEEAPRSSDLAGARSRLKRLVTLTRIAETMINSFLSSRLVNFAHFDDVLDLRQALGTSDRPRPADDQVNP